MLVIMIGNRERRIPRFGCRCIFLKRNSESSLDTSTSEYIVRMSDHLLSREEEAELVRSNKKVKNVGHAEFDGQMNEDQAFLPGMRNITRHPLSFKDRLVGELPGAYSQAFNFTECMDAEEESDSETTDLREGLIAVKFSKDQKRRFRSPWSKALIVKVFGRSVGFSFLHSRLMSLWKPVGKIDCVGLGNEFVSVRFALKEDCEAVLRNGPWFIGGNFLSIRPWVPDFNPSEASIASVAVWVRLTELPIEYYNVEALQIIGNAIGRVLRIDTHTANESRGRFARLCIQVDIEKPLITALLIGGREKHVSYEGIQRLCFSCGRIGHRRESCPYAVRNDQARKTEVGENTPEQGHREGSGHLDASAGTNSVKPMEAGTCVGAQDLCEGTSKDTSNDVYGPWVVVTRKKGGNKTTRKDGPTD